MKFAEIYVLIAIIVTFSSRVVNKKYARNSDRFSSVLFDTPAPICYTVPILPGRGKTAPMQAELQPAGTYDTILHSALQVFSRKGYVEAKMEDIARDASVNTATVYRHFTDKKSLFLAVVDNYGPLEEGAFPGDCHLSYTDVSADLYVLAEEYFKIIYDNIDILKIFMGESCYISKIKDQAWHIPPALVEHFSGYLERVGENRRTTKKSRRLTAELFLSDIIHFAVVRISEAQHPTMDKALLADFSAHMDTRVPCLLVILKQQRYVK